MNTDTEMKCGRVCWRRSLRNQKTPGCGKAQHFFTEGGEAEITWDSVYRETIQCRHPEEDPGQLTCRRLKAKLLFTIHHLRKITASRRRARRAPNRMARYISCLRSWRAAPRASQWRATQFARRASVYKSQSSNLRLIYQLQTTN
jgi:hypothetical protein